MIFYRARDTQIFPAVKFIMVAFQPFCCPIMPIHSQIINIAAYKFVTFDASDEARTQFLAQCTKLALKGTILLSTEGINLFLAGTRAAIDTFLRWLKSDLRFSDIEVKVSNSHTFPFRRMLVKLKPEIITMRRPLVSLESGRAPAITPATLKRWLDNGCDDDGRSLVMLDTRNSFEVEVGTFVGAIDCKIGKFSDFPNVVGDHRTEFQDKTAVTFCTGGIRCEKAAIFMSGTGFKNVYQLDGGILKYFEDVGNCHYEGECFVFDERTSLTSDLMPSETLDHAY